MTWPVLAVWCLTGTAVLVIIAIVEKVWAWVKRRGYEATRLIELDQQHEAERGRNA